ncbi:hypothetical protein B0H13DRAFT_2521621 [Mycena leptocephala]|nr:hypothetical protein B0H13DRAFT_2521621 [Mycena leptocephala]
MLSTLATDRARVADIEVPYRYPVLTLPNEIISEIFIHFLPVYPLCPPSTGILSPTLLTQICRRWREISLATPALWKAVSLSSSGVPLKRRAHISNLLSRSGCCPLSIQLDQYADHFEEDEYDDDEVRVSEALSAGIPHCARWEYLTIRIFQSHLPTIEGPIPLLRHLELSLGINDDDSEPPTTVIAFREAPLLRTAILDDTAALIVILPWAQLTSLTLTRVEPQECVPLLQQTSNLVYCELRVCYFGHDPFPPDITVLSLETLIIKDPIGGQVEPYLETFILPALHTLEIPERFLGPTPIDSLASFISKSGCKPQDLCVTDMTGGVAQYTYREAFPSIIRFSSPVTSDATG